MPLRAIPVVVFLVALSVGGWLLAARGPGRPMGPPDFASIRPPEARKEAFFRWLTPAVEQENERIRRVRRRIERLLGQHEAGQRLAPHDRVFLTEMAELYRTVSPDEDPGPALRALLRRVDTVPPRLALVQAAVESGWGTGRFAREGNNYFGVWTWRPEGIVPAAREEGADHAVAAYPDAAASVRAYLYTLDVGPAYTELRRLRAQARAAGRRPRALDLAQGLHGYSERGSAYVTEIRQMLRANADLLDAVLEDR
jgi:Bax protein